jgi:hypothetical protein
MRAYLGELLTTPAPQTHALIISPSDFIRYVEDTFRSHNLRINVLIMSPRLSEPAVVRRQIIEGVLAIVRIDMAALSKSKVNVQIFDRRSGASNVQFNGKSKPPYSTSFANRYPQNTPISTL